MNVKELSINEKEGFQSIILPEEFYLNDDKVYVKKTGNTLQIIPFHQAWNSFKDSLNKFSPDFMDERNQNLIN
jgi:antitoxin VapB